MPFSAAHLSRILDQTAVPVQRLWVAYSGGIDSHVLLHRLVNLRDGLPPLAGAIHIHHDLSLNADSWAEHCQATCHQLGIGCKIIRVHIDEGEGVEDSARRARYAAIQSCLQTGDAILLAQHQDDQAETFLIQALRGGGPHGLAAMPALAPLGQGFMVRPMLGISRQEVQEYAASNELHWAEDESNLDSRFDRNYIRHVIFPKLLERWPAASRTLARTASHTAALVNITDELLQDELHDVIGSRPDTLSINALKTLSHERASLLIRAICHQLQLPVPATSHIRELLDKQLHADTDRQIHINWSGAEFRRYQDDLFILSPLPEIEASNWRYHWDGSHPLEIPQLHGELRLEACSDGGLDRKIIHQGLVVRPRSGSERCQPSDDDFRRDLKTIYQNHHIPPWERERLPLIYAEEKLVAIADIVVCQQAGASDSEDGYRVIWQRTD